VEDATTLSWSSAAVSVSEYFYACRRRHYNLTYLLLFITIIAFLFFWHSLWTLQ